MTLANPIETWAVAREALAAQGYPYVPPEPSTDWQRFAAAGKPERNRSAAVRLADDGSAVHLVDHVTSYRTTVQPSKPGTGPIRRPSRPRAASVEQDGKSNRAERQRQGAERVNGEYRAATACNGHPYLATKGVPSVPGLRVDSAARLLVPRRMVDGELVALQRIARDGTKRYSTGTPTSGTFFGIGTVDPAGTLLVAEGLATGITVHVEAGHPCAVAFDCGNLRAVAMLLRAKYPAVRIVLCADDDRQTTGNPGRTKALEAARVVGGHIARPPLCHCCTCTDFNDASACARRRGAA